MKFHVTICLLILALIGHTACRRAEQDVAHDERPRIVATTTIVGDMVARIGGDDIRLSVILPPVADPHDYVFRPADMVLAAEADAVFINGAGLEGDLKRLLQGAVDSDTMVDLSRNVPVRHFEDRDGHEHGHECAHDDVDPHYWTDPSNLMVWAGTITEALTRLIPERGESFQRRKADLLSELRELDQWIQEKIAALPAERRLLVTDHHALGYFADRYGFEEAGVVIKSFDSAAQSSARDMARLVDTLRARGIRAIFVGKSVNPQLARQVARDTGSVVVPLYTGGLSESDGPADDYFAYMRYNVSQIVEHLASDAE